MQQARIVVPAGIHCPLAHHWQRWLVLAMGGQSASVRNSSNCSRGSSPSSWLRRFGAKGIHWLEWTLTSTTWCTTPNPLGSDSKMGQSKRAKRSTPSSNGWSASTPTSVWCWSATQNGWLICWHIPQQLQKLVPTEDNPWLAYNCHFCKLAEANGWQDWSQF